MTLPTPIQATLGPLVHAVTVDRAIIATLRMWLPYYLRTAEQREGLPTSWLARPRSWTTTYDEDDEDYFSDHRLPCVIVTSEEFVDWQRTGNKDFSVHCPVAITVVARGRSLGEARLQSALYCSVITELLMDKHSLGGLCGGIDPVSERPLADRGPQQPLPAPDRRHLGLRRVPAQRAPLLRRPTQPRSSGGSRRRNRPAAHGGRRRRADRGRIPGRTRNPIGASWPSASSSPPRPRSHPAESRRPPTPGSWPASPPSAPKGCRRRSATCRASKRSSAPAQRPATRPCGTRSKSSSVRAASARWSCAEPPAPSTPPWTPSRRAWARARCQRSATRSRRTGRPPSRSGSTPASTTGSPSARR